MSQTIKGSTVETAANIAVGFTINYFANFLILPIFGFHGISAGNNFLMGVMYTGVSVARSFGLRRLFNHIKFGNITVGK